MTDQGTQIIWTWDDVAAHFKKSKSAVMRWPIPRLPVPGHPRFDAAEVIAWGKQRALARRKFYLGSAHDAVA